MLSTITAAEMQFRHEDGRRRKEFALLASIRERRAAETRAADHGTVVPAASRTTARASWPRPIGVAHAGPAGAACVA